MLQCSQVLESLNAQLYKKHVQRTFWTIIIYHNHLHDSYCIVQKHFCHHHTILPPSKPAFEGILAVLLKLYMRGTQDENFFGSDFEI
jgi:hypothetical protein